MQVTSLPPYSSPNKQVHNPGDYAIIYTFFPHYSLVLLSNIPSFCPCLQCHSHYKIFSQSPFPCLSTTKKGFDSYEQILAGFLRERKKNIEDGNREKKRELKEKEMIKRRSAET